jgi:hypothetical protein
MDKQTDYLIDDLIAGIKNSDSFFERCFLINELGVVANKGGGEASKIESKLGKLVELLSSPEKSDRWIAVRYLLRLQSDNRASGITTEALVGFMTDGSNRDLLPTPEEI